MKSHSTRAHSKAHSKPHHGDHCAQRTKDHETIKRWAEERHGFPTQVKGTGDTEEAGVLRIDFPDFSGAERLEKINWDEFFRKFDENHLEFLYQDKTADGRVSRFAKFVRAED